MRKQLLLPVHNFQMHISYSVEQKDFLFCALLSIFGHNASYLLVCLKLKINFLRSNTQKLFIYFSHFPYQITVKKYYLLILFFLLFFSFFFTNQTSNTQRKTKWLTIVAFQTSQRPSRINLLKPFSYNFNHSAHLRTAHLFFSFSSSLSISTKLNFWEKKKRPQGNIF